MRALLSALVALTLLAGSAFVADAGGRSMGAKVDDAWITTKVKAKLSTEQVKSLVNVNVDTKDGVVHLQGVVPTLADRADAERLALDTEGVLSVRNDLKVATSTGSSPAASPSTR